MAGLLLRERSHLRRLPGAVQQVPRADDTLVATFVYPPIASATTTTLLFKSGIGVEKVKVLRGHRHLTTTHVYDKRRRSSAHSSSPAVTL